MSQDLEAQPSETQKKDQGKKVAGGEGFEPSLSEPESDVLPLDDPPIREKA